MTEPFVIIVEFNLRSADQMIDFRRLVDENAIASVNREPGCQRFDVAVPNDRKDQIILYEIYDDEAAFEAHLKTRHYLEFNAAAAAFIESRTIRTCTLVCEGSSQTTPSEG